jgi:uncharacterized membrane protein YfcA
MTPDSTPPRRSRLPRLHQWYAKALYVVVAIGIYYFGGALASTDNARGILRSILVLLMVLLAARVFRGAAEPGDEPRAWWRMTGAPLSGFILGVICGLIGVALLVWSIATQTDAMLRQFRAQELYVVVTCVVFVVLAVLYLTSSIRLVELARAARRDARSASTPA